MHAETRFAEFVRRVLASHETSSLHPLPDLMPVLPVLDPAAPELALARRDRRATGCITTAPIAGQYPNLRFANPINSGRIVILERFVLVCGTSANFRTECIVGTAGGTAQVFKQYVDTRGTPGQPCALMFRDTSAALVNGTFIGYMSSVYHNVFTPGVVLAPGTYWQLDVTTVNLTVYAGLEWRERGPHDDELNASGA